MANPVLSPITVVPSSGQVSHVPLANQLTNADLPALHALLGHYARLYWDLQKVRIAIGNRADAMERDGLDEAWQLPLSHTGDGLGVLEHEVQLQLTRLARQHPMAPWIKQAKGIGLPGFAGLLGVTGPLDRFPNPAKLWAYVGMGVVDGQAPKKVRGEKLHYSPQGRVLCHQLGDAIVKVGGDGPYRAAYDTKKAHYQETHPEWTDGHRHNAAMRYAVKELLKDMWNAWREYVPSHA